jgi:hypothetical protein
MKRDTYSIKFTKNGTFTLVKLLCKKKNVRINTFLNEAIEKEVKEQSKTLDPEDLQSLIKTITR